uniref:Uncharacterized protein n=1 Tax=Glossina palpalis gambiensis TaxID=67801 RepID=A0A1B0B1K7_9MUSC
MNFYKIFVFIALIIVLSLSQSEAELFTKICKIIKCVGQNTRDATVKGLEVGQQAANVVATVKG